MARSVLLAVLALALTACGEEGVQLSANDPDYEGARLFDLNCGMCHSLSAAGTQGSASDVNVRELKDGPNFNDRVENKDDVLYAIRNGGFSSGPMPQNLVTGEDAEKVADFVAKYAGRGASGGVSEPTQPGPEGATPEGPGG